MYQDYYQFHCLPFENTPDPRFFFASEQHCEALAALEYTVRMRKGFVLVTGDIGAGKTTISRTMCARCRPHATVVELLHGHQEAAGVIAQVLRRLGLRHGETDDHGRLLERLQQFLQSRAERAQPVVLLVDEAQSLSDAALEELRLLSNLDSATARLIQIVLVGQPELRRRIASPQHAALRQRIAMARQLRPLNAADTGRYINHRLTAAAVAADGCGISFDSEAINAIFAYTRGIPRLINAVCDNCLLLGMVKETFTITAAMVRQVTEDMVPQLDAPAPQEQQPAPALGQPSPQPDHGKAMQHDLAPHGREHLSLAA